MFHFSSSIGTRNCGTVFTQECQNHFQFLENVENSTILKKFGVIVDITTKELFKGSSWQQPKEPGGPASSGWECSNTTLVKRKDDKLKCLFCLKIDKDEILTTGGKERRRKLIKITNPSSPKSWNQKPSSWMRLVYFHCCHPETLW